MDAKADSAKCCLAFTVVPYLYVLWENTEFDYEILAVS